MFRKLWLMIVLLLLMFSLMAGCNSDNGGDSDNVYGDIQRVVLVEMFTASG